jgi:hypothetical protein
LSKKHFREVMEKAQEAAAAFGCTVRALDRRGGHLMLSIEAPTGGALPVPVSCSPTDDRAALNMVLQVVRRRCRELTS